MSKLPTGVVLDIVQSCCAVTEDCFFWKVLWVSNLAKGMCLSCRQLALKYHPDKAITNAQKSCASIVFKLISEANSTLSDTDKRQQYDASLLRRKYRTARYTAYRF